MFSYFMFTVAISVSPKILGKSFFSLFSKCSDFFYLLFLLGQPVILKCSFFRLELILAINSHAEHILKTISALGCWGWSLEKLWSIEACSIGQWGHINLNRHDICFTHTHINKIDFMVVLSFSTNAIWKLIYKFNFPQNIFLHD